MLGRALRKGLVVSTTADGRSIMLGGKPTAAGIRVSPSHSMTASSVFSATSLRADTVASLPMRFIRRDDKTRKPELPDVARVLWSGRPNPQQTTGSFIASVILSKLLWGNAYIYPRRSNGGDVAELWPLDPDRVEVEPLGDQGALRFKVQDFKEIDNVPGKPFGIIHVPHLTLPGRYKGLSPIEAQAELVGMSLSSQEHAARFLGEGVHMTGVIEAPQGTKAADAQEMAKGFAQRHAGPKKTGAVGVLVGGVFKPLTIPPNELQFLEQMKYSDAKIASGIYRVPPHMIGDTEKSTSWGTGIEQQSLGFVAYTLQDWLTAWEETIGRDLISEDDIYAKFNPAGLLRGDINSRYAAYSTARQWGWLSINDIRELEDLNPIENGDDYLQPMNMEPAGTPAESASQKRVRKQGKTDDQSNAA